MQDPFVDRPALRTALNELGPNSLNILDVGARTGALDPWFRLKPLARLHGFDPDPSLLERSSSAFESSFDHFYPSALGKLDGEATLHVTRDPAYSSLLTPSGFPRERFPTLRSALQPQDELLVPILRVQTWADRSNIDRVDFIKLDTQGSELDILAGAGHKLELCVGVEADVVFSPMYIGQPLFSDVDAYLRSRGFTLWRLSNMTYYCEHPSDRLCQSTTAQYDNVTVNYSSGDGQLARAKAIYFKDRATVPDRHSLLALASLLEAAGEKDSSQACLVMLAEQSNTWLTSVSEREKLLENLDLPPGDARRVRITVGCDDTQGIPKVPGAGSRVTESDTKLQLMHNGLKILEGCYHGPWMTSIIEMLGGHHEPQEERAFFEVLRYLRPGANMLELGSFWAYYSMWFAKALPGGRCVMVEPDPNNLAVGQQNFAINGLAGDFLQGTVGDRNAPAKPFLCESDNANHDVAQLCVDEVLQQSGLQRVDLLLADIQGAELDMLHGAATSIEQGRIRFVFVSTHHHAISNDPLIHQKCIEFIRARRGHILAEHNVAESFSGDGLIVASFDPADRNFPPIHVSRNWPSNSLFRESEYDLAEACKAITDIGQEFGELVRHNPQIAAEMNRIRQMNALLSKNWPEFV